MPSEQFQQIKQQLAEANPDAILFDGFEEALIGICTRFGQPPIACYDREKCIDILIKRDKMDHEGAEECFEYNTAGGWYGENTPCFLTVLRVTG